MADTDGKQRARARAVGLDVTPEMLLDRCMRLVDRHLRALEAEPEDRMNSHDVHALAKLMPVLQASIIYKLDPFGELGERRRRLLEKSVEATEKYRQLDDARTKSVG